MNDTEPTVQNLFQLSSTNVVEDNDSLECMDVADMQPIWLIVVGTFLQQIIVLIIQDKMPDGKYEGGFFTVWVPSESNNTCIRYSSKAFKFVLVCWQIMSIILIFILDCIHLSDNYYNSNNGYQCYAQVLIYSSNLKTIIVNIAIPTIRFIDYIFFYDEWTHLEKHDNQSWSSFLGISIPLLIVSWIAFLPYIPVIFSHLLFGLGVYIWVWIAGVIPLIIIYGFMFCVTFLSDHCDNCESVLKMMWNIGCGTIVSTIYVLIIIIMMMSCHYETSWHYIGSITIVLSERQTSQYYNKLLNEAKSFFRFMTYLV
eukprot:309160_1